MKRSPHDNCLICHKNKAIKTNSHIIPAGLLKNSIGKRNKEEAYRINGQLGTANSYFGRENLKNTSEEIKQDIHARDFYFCPSCESRLGELESKVIPFLTEKILNEKYKNQFVEKTSKSGIRFLEASNIVKTDFLVFVYSVIWRIALLYAEEHEKYSLKEEEMEDIRSLIYSYLYYENHDLINNVLNKYGFALATAESFDPNEGNAAFTVDFLDNPNIYFIYEFIVFLHSVDDPAVATPFYECMNSGSQTIKVSVLTVKQWNRAKELFVKLLANNVIDKQIEQLVNITGKSFLKCQFLLATELATLNDGDTIEMDFFSMCKIAIENISKRLKSSN